MVDKGFDSFRNFKIRESHKQKNQRAKKIKKVTLSSSS